ncbi:DUF1707 domain-containing protein [Streptomyces sp. ODS28]|uniref:DUF1707 SHOCT-like domain-containing protein n=1 Tax=Streptomyces sp. ODS28 TaxID=3136688 RepID=UPI0031E95485
MDARHDPGQRRPDQRISTQRVSDQDRDAALAVLSAALSQGRLDSQEHAERSRGTLEARTRGKLEELTADLPAPRPSAREQDRKDLREWLDEWRYWLGGVVVLSAIWGARCVAKGELTFYWPLTPLAVWAAVLVAIAVWPRGTEKEDTEKGGTETRETEKRDTEK